MKHVVIGLLATLALTPITQGASLIWAGSSQIWDLSTPSWQDTGTGSPSVFSQGDEVRFDDTGLAQLSVALGANQLSPASVTVDSTGDFTFTSSTGGKLTGAVALFKRGSGTLVLDADHNISGPTSIEGGVLQIGGGSGRGSLGTGPVTNQTGIVIQRTGALTLINFLTGSGGFTNRLNATVNLWGTNDMDGTVFVQIGMLTLSNAPAAGRAPTFTLDASTGGTANARLGLISGVELPAATKLQMMGTSSSGPTRCTVQTSAAADTSTNIVRGQILVGSGSGLVQLSAASAGLLEIHGDLVNHPDNPTPFAGSIYVRGAGQGVLLGSINLPEANLIRTDAGTFTLASRSNTWAGTLVAVGRLRLGADHALPDVPFSIGQGAGTNAILDLNGCQQRLPGLNSVHAANVNVPIIANSSTNADAVLTIDGPGGLYSGALQDSIAGGTRTVGLQILAGAQQLASECTYSGPTVIQAGGLVLKDAGSIPNTVSIDLTGPAALDVSLRTDSTFTLRPAQTLKGTGSINITGNLVSQGTLELKLNKASGVLSADKINATGQLSCQGALRLVLSGEAVTPSDEWEILSAGSYGPIAFARIEPASPGPGLFWDSSTLAADGKIRILGPLSLQTSMPVPGTPGGSLELAGSGGVPGRAFAVLTSTDATAPLAQWTSVQAGSFDGQGRCSVSLAIQSGEPQRFFRLSVP